MFVYSKEYVHSIMKCYAIFCFLPESSASSELSALNISPMCSSVSSLSGRITLACSTTFLSASTLNKNFVVNKYIISFSVGLPLASDHPKRCWITYEVRFKSKIISLN